MKRIVGLILLWVGIVCFFCTVAAFVYNGLYVPAWVFLVLCGAFGILSANGLEITLKNSKKSLDPK